MKILNNAGEPNGSTTYMWDDEFYCLAAESFTGFDQYSKGLRVELALALLSDFLKKVTFAIFEREPKGVRSLIRPHLYTRLWVANPVQKEMAR